MSDENIVGEEVAKKYRIYKHSFAIKNESVEQYKSQQAILRNSVRYLPEAGEIAQKALASSDTELELKQMSKDLNASKLFINQYLLGIENFNNIKKQLEKLKQSSKTQPNNIKDKLQVYLTHSNLILKHKPQAEDMLKTAMSVDIAKLSSDLVNQYAVAQDVVVQKVKQLQKIMLAGTILLLALLAWFLIGLRKSNQKIVISKAENKDIQQQLLKSEGNIEETNKNIIQIEEKSAAGLLSINAVKQLDIEVPSLTKHLSFLTKLKTKNTLSESENELDNLITDITKVRDNISDINKLIDPEANNKKQVTFNFNHIINAAFNKVHSEA